MQPKDTEERRRAIDRVNRAYADEDYDRYERLIERYLGDAEEFYPDEHPQILEREVGYIFPLMEVEPTICIELKNEEDEG